MIYKRLKKKVWDTVTEWLTKEPADPSTHLSDYERMRHEIKPTDVVLVEGRSRVSEIIKTITLSSWSHAALYIGRLHDIEDLDLRDYIQYLYDADPGEPLMIEALLGEGTFIAPLSKYKDFHVRICRPKGLSHADTEKVVRYCVGCVTLGYDIRQILDLARFMFPYGILPRRWRSSLFEHNSGLPTQTVCSTMIAQAFHEVNFPVLPLLISHEKAKMSLKERNTKLFTPRDFDYSPYFEIVKYPLLSIDELTTYRKLPWIEEQQDTSHSHKIPAEKPTEAHLQIQDLSEKSWSIHTFLKSMFGGP